MTCCVCGKKQSPFLCDYPLTNQALSERICLTCNENIEKLAYSAEQGDVKAFNEAKSIFDQCHPSKTVSTYLQQCIDKHLAVLNENYDARQQRELFEKQKNELSLEYLEKINSVLLTTTHTVEGQKIVEYKGIVNAEVVLGTGLLSEVSAGMADFFGTQSSILAQKLNTARNTVHDALKRHAVEKACNGIIAIHYDYVLFAGNIIGIVANGTAVVLKTTQTASDVLANLE